jgi:hypothetical protein
MQYGSTLSLEETILQIAKETTTRTIIKSNKMQEF